MYTLYARPGAGSFVVEAVLAEAGQRYKLVEVERGADGRAPASFLKINPMGQVPTLVLPDKSLMTESAAMVIHIADRYPKSGLAPAMRSKQRAEWLRWLLFMSSTIYSSALRFYYSARYTTEPAGAGAVKDSAIAALEREWDVLAKALGKGPWLLGKKFSAIDIYAAMLATWNPDVPAFYKRHPNVAALCERVKSRKAIAPLWAANEMP